MTDLPSDESMLLESARRDPRAFAAFHDRYVSFVYARALAILHCREDAEDLTQEVFLCVCEADAYDRTRGTVAAFLGAMTRSRALDRLRQRARSARFLSGWQREMGTRSTGSTPLGQLASRRTAELVRARLAELPAMQRRVLEMAYYDGLTQLEISAGLGAPIGTVKSLSRRALIALSRALRVTPLAQT
jgi:RNA polymerase sigma-70 factor (ECF subfamily)